MDNSKKNVHNSGFLGMLIKSGQIRQIDVENDIDGEKINQPNENSGLKTSYFQTQSGIEFSEQDLVFIDPKECEPWEYANRLDDEMGNMDELMASIREHKQLQPALVRTHPKPHGGIKYEIIFGRRRHLACLQLGIPFMVIRKDTLSTQDAVASQDAENKLRNNVSNYSNAILYKKLLSSGIFKTEKELAQKLAISSSTFSELMAFAKIPEDIVKLIPNIHSLSISMAIKITSLLKNSENYSQILSIAPTIGQTITSPIKLEKVLKHKQLQSNTIPAVKARVLKSINGNKLFTFKVNHRGSPCIVIDRNLEDRLNHEQLCNYLKDYFEKILA